MDKNDVIEKTSQTVVTLTMTSQTVETFATALLSPPFHRPAMKCHEMVFLMTSRDATHRHPSNFWIETILWRLPLSSKVGSNKH